MSISEKSGDVLDHESLTAAEPAPHVALRVLNAGVSVVHNAYVNCIGLLILCFWVQGSQLASFDKHEVVPSSYMLDGVSNVINLVFIMRFCFGAVFMPFEVVFMVFQVGYMGVCIASNLPWAYTVHDFFDVVYLVQLVIPVLLNVINVYECVTEGASLRHFLVNFNNNFVPLLISNSFVFINLKYPLFSGHHMAVEAFIYAQISLKFYCLYQYIMYELGVVKPSRGLKTYMLIFTTSVLLVVDMLFVYLTRSVESGLSFDF